MRKQIVSCDICSQEFNEKELVSKNNLDYRMISKESICNLLGRPDKFAPSEAFDVCVHCQKDFSNLFGDFCKNKKAKLG